MEYICEICLIKFDRFQDKANHVRWKHLANKSKNIECFKKASETQYGKWIECTIKCNKSNCDNNINIKFREKLGPKKKYFCSRSCANSRGPRSNEFKKIVSSKLKEKWRENHWGEFNYSANKKFSSKKEREILLYFKEKYKNDEWTSGGALKVENNIISRDMYSNKLKICFEYDGIWHFKDIHGQLEKKKIKDKLLEKWCIENEFRLIRMEDGFFENFSQIENLIYNCKDPIIKIGTSY